MEAVRDVVLTCLKGIHHLTLEQAGDLTAALASQELPGEPGHAWAGDFYHLIGGYDQILAFIVNDGQTVLERDLWDERLGFDITTEDDDPLFLSLGDDQWQALREYGAAVFAETEAVIAATPEEQLLARVEGAESNDPLWALQISYLLVSAATHAGELQAMHGVLTGQRPAHH